MLFRGILLTAKDICRTTEGFRRYLDDCRSCLESSEGLKSSPVEPVEPETNVTELQDDVKTKPMVLLCRLTCGKKA